MKKINTLKMLCLCALGCICATNATAQSTGTGLYRIADERATDLVPGQDYVIYNTARNGSNDRTGFIFANNSNGLGLTKKKPVNKEILTAEYVWTVETGTDGEYYLKSKSKNTYVGPNGGTSNAEGVAITIEKWTETQAPKTTAIHSENPDGTTQTTIGTITADNRVWVIGDGANSWWNGNATGFSSWSDAHPFAFYAVEELGDDDMVQVTYNYVTNGEKVGEETFTCYNHCAPLAPQTAFPVYVTATGFPATIESENGTATHNITVEYNNQLPFHISTDETSVYYLIALNVIVQNGTSTPYRWYANASNQGKEENTTYNGLTLATEQNWKWKFVGDWLNGFNIMTQSGKYLTTNSTTANQAGTSLTDTPDASKSYFLLQRYTDLYNHTGWRFALKGSSLKLAHTNYRTLNIDTWAADNYNGAHLIFEEMGDFQTMLNELRSAKDEAKGYLDMTHVGTPVADATERTELQSTVTQIDNLNDNTVSYQTYKPLPEALTTKLTAYLACTNLLMPESGKAYTIVFRPANKETGTYRYVNFTGTGLQAVAMANKDSEIPESGVFVVRSWTDGSTTKYAMVPAYGNVYGKYLAHNNIYNGWATDNRTEFTVTSVLSATNKGYITDQSNKNLFGYASFTFTKRNDGNSGVSMIIINESNGRFDATGVPFLNGAHTSFLIVKEVEGYPSSVQLNAVDNIEGITAIGTFSAPYAAIVPEGVTAHYISSVGNKAQATAIAEGEAIPAGQGVLLTGEAGRVTMAPATTETQAAISGNLLGNTAGGAKALTYGSDYILTSGTLPNGNQGVAFYPISATDLTVSANKAYLHTEGTNAPALVLSFGEGETDGVKGIDDVKGKQAPVFDLQGRRVQKTAKGLYIQNGKKFMVK